MANSLRDLMDVLADQYGIEPLVPNEDDVYFLNCDGISVTLGSFVAEDVVFLYSPIADFDSVNAEAISLALLGFNHDFFATSGVTFSQDSESGNYALEQIVSLSTLTEESFPRILSDFIGMAREWSARIRCNELEEAPSQNIDEEELSNDSTQEQQTVQPTDPPVASSSEQSTEQSTDPIPYSQWLSV